MRVNQLKIRIQLEGKSDTNQTIPNQLKDTDRKAA